MLPPYCSLPAAAAAPAKPPQNHRAMVAGVAGARIMLEKASLAVGPADSTISFLPMVSEQTRKGRRMHVCIYVLGGRPRRCRHRHPPRHVESAKYHALMRWFLPFLPRPGPHL